jgi:RHS repeat-associated protein
VTKPVTVTVASQTSQPYTGLQVFAFDGPTYTGYNGTTDTKGQVIFTLPEGSYRFRADYNGVQFWSGNENSCTLPGCATATVTLPGGQSTPTNVTINYTYDPLYRLTAADYSDGKYFHYTYDAVGNRLTQDANLAGQPASTSYTYDSANRLTNVGGVAYAWDANGNLLNDGTNTYAYDSANRLTTVSGGQNAISYKYDGLGNRLQQVVNGTKTTYINDLNAGLTQVLDDGTNTYLYGNDRIAQLPVDAPQNPDYFLGDALGSVRQMTDESGVVVYTASYDPYGEVLSTNGVAQTSYGYAGEQVDSYIKLINLRSRQYSPLTGTFLTRDSWQGSANTPMSYNSWVYGYSDPVRYTDPSGQFASEYLDFTYASGYGDRTQPRWGDADEQALDNSAQAVGQALANTINNQLMPMYQKIEGLNEPWTHSFIRPVTAYEAFMQVYGQKVEIQRQPSKNRGVWAVTKSYDLIYFYTTTLPKDLSNPIYSRFLSHELGHAFENAVNGTFVEPLFIRQYLHGDISCSSPLLQMPANLKDDREGLRSNSGRAPEGYWQFHPDSDEMFEVFADMFVAWTYDDPNGQRGWATKVNGSLTDDAFARSNVMNTDMPYFIDAARWRWYLAGRWQ